ncbi:MAG TPA: glycoside hydrolase family 2, partial [Verrucomicrobiae bacterium]
AGTNGQPSQVHLQLRAGESVLLRAYQSRHVTGPAWTYRQPPCTPVVLTGTWQVDFVEGGPVLPAPAQLTQLTSWTTLSDTNCQAFAGTARYQLHFSTPDLAGQTVELSLGRVAQSARVRLNGKDYGTLLLPPYTVTVDNLKATENLLEVDVTSVSANRIRDLDQRGVKWKTFRDINIVDINYKPFDASNWPLTDCGLLGPVTVAK